MDSCYLKTLLGLTPRRCGAPVAMMPCYLYRIFQFFLAGNTEASHAPPPPTGEGLAQGGHSNKEGFHQKILDCGGVVSQFIKNISKNICSFNPKMIKIFSRPFMKQTTHAQQLILILLAAIILNVVFWGMWFFHPWTPAYPYNAHPPDADATLWQKEQWEQYHGAICTCVPVFNFQGPVTLVSTNNNTVSSIIFNITDFVSLGDVPNMTGVNITVSTATVQKTVHADCQSVKLSRFTETRKVRDEYNISYFVSNETVQVNIDLGNMGFTSNDIVPNQKLSLVLIPPVGHRAAKTIIIPRTLQPGGITEVF